MADSSIIKDFSYKGNTHINRGGTGWPADASVLTGGIFPQHFLFLSMNSHDEVLTHTFIIKGLPDATRLHLHRLLVISPLG